METFIEDAQYQNLSLRKAEQKKLNSLKNMNLPWIFVEPTRLKSVKIPKSRKKLNYYEDLDDEDLEFLGNSKIPFTKDDIKILQQSLRGENNSITVQNSEFYHTLQNADKLHENDLLIDENLNRTEKNDFVKTNQNLKLETISEENEEDIVTSRSNKNATDDLFASDNDKPKKYLEEEERMEVETETVKNIIMSAVKEREETSKWKKKKIELNRPITLFSYNAKNTTPEGQNIAKERMTKGRRKLLSAIRTSSSLKHEEDSISYAKNKYEKENNLKRAALEKCFGIKRFKDYLEMQNAEIPKILLDIT